MASDVIVEVPLTVTSAPMDPYSVINALANPIWYSSYLFLYSQYI